jgi:DHA2 family multidrug resistance protein
VATGAKEVPHRGILTVCVMLATIMQALDTTIANVALPYMMGSLSATLDQINWVLIPTAPPGDSRGIPRFGLS